jgi:hypothetical protein
MVPKEEEQRKNTEKYMVEPLGVLCMIVADLLSAKDASGELYIPHVNKVDDVMDKGTVVAAGKDVKAVKVGDRVQYLFNSFFEIDQFYREHFNQDGARRGIVKEGDITMKIRPLKKDEKPESDAWAEGLLPADHLRAREETLRRQEARAKLGGRR